MKIEYNKVIKIESNFILYGNNETVILKGDNSLDDKSGNKILKNENKIIKVRKIHLNIKKCE